MREFLITKLHEYIIHNNLDMLISLQQEERVGSYLKEKIATADDFLYELQQKNKPAYIIKELCIEYLTKDLRPSRFNYILSVLEEDFEKCYYSFRESGILIYEVINLIETCNPIFKTLEFNSDNENDRHLRYAIIGAVSEYLNNNQ